MIGTGKTKNASWIWRGIEGSKCIIEKQRCFLVGNEDAWNDPRVQPSHISNELITL